MPRIVGALLILLRIALVWLSLYGAGAISINLLGRARVIGDGSIGRILAGMCAFLLFIPLLSLMSIMNRVVVPTVVVALAVAGAFALIRNLRGRGIGFPRPAFLFVPLALLALFLCLTNVFRACRPNDHSDALITYAVQPDRWLNEGRICFLEETEFSAMPLVGEILSVPAASLSLDRLDQLSLLQAFQMTLLLGALLYGSRRLGAGGWGIAIALCAGAACPLLAGWGALAKVDMTAAFLTTIALSGCFAAGQSGSRVPAWAWLAFGLAAATKLTVWLLLPAFAILAAFAGECRIGRKALSGRIGLLLLVPAAFAIRTWLHTGTPFYPFGLPLLPPSAAWVRASAPALDALSTRMHAAVSTEIIDLLEAWSTVLYLLLIGIAALVFGKKLRSVVSLLVAIALTFGLGLAFLRPLAWGAKYTMPMLPFLACTGGLWLARSKVNLAGQALLVALLCATTPIAQRAQFLASFVTSGVPLQFDSDTYRSPRPVHLWANANLPQGTRLLSVFSAERYFSDHPVICARTHHAARRLFAVDGLEAELAILRDLGITHVYFDAADPMQLNFLSLNYWSPPDDARGLAGELSILTAVDSAGPLVPVALVEGFQVCEVRYPE
jgi:hypothetical protein